MTNMRITDNGAADDWTHCPYCGHELVDYQATELLVHDADGYVDPEASEAAGFVFDDMVKSCGFHVKIWASRTDDTEVE